MRVGRSYRSLKIHKAEVGSLEDIGNIGEKRSSALRAISGGGCCGPYRLMRNHIAGHGKAHLG